MLELDGSDAGGQYLRSALTLAAIDGRPVRIENVRGDRSTPGLRPQHLAVVETMAAICDAAVSGVETGSETVTFEPDLGRTESGDVAIPGGSYAADIGTAGSVTLLFDAVLPLATRLDAPLSLTVTGGTDVKWSPTLAYVRRVKLPLLRRYGLQAAVEVDRRGFYPAGGGRLTCYLAPSTLSPIRLDERGSLRGVRLYSTESASLADQAVADRQLGAALDRLESETDAVTDEGGYIDVAERVVTTAESESPGSAITCRLDFENGIAGTDALGERGTPAERVGEAAAAAAVRLLDGASPVDSYLGDQILIWLARAGGRVRIPSVTDHVETSLSLLGAFGYGLECRPVSTTDATEPPEATLDEHVVSTR